MSTSFDFDVAGYAQGTWGYAYVNSQRCLVPQGTNSRYDWSITGTDATMLMAVSSTGTNYFQAAIDGGSWSDITSPGTANTYTAVTLFSGLSDAAHAVSIRNNAGTPTNAMCQVLNGLSVTGASPAVANPSGVGPVYALSSPKGVAFGFPEGQVNYDNSSGHNRMVFPIVDACFRFRGNPTSIRLFCYTGSGGKIRVTQDGTAVGSPTSISGSLTYDWITVASGLDGATHEYEISLTTATAAYMVQISLVGGDFDKVTLPAWRPAILWIGDSISMGQGTGDSSLAFPWRISQSKGYQCVNFAQSGMTCLSLNTSGNSAERLSPPADSPNMGNIQENYSYVVINIGHNDSESSAEFQASLQRLAQACLDAYRNATIYIVGVFPTNAFDPTALRTAQQAAVTAIGDSRLTYISTDSLWGTGGSPPTSTQINTNTTDGVHPNSTGYAAAYTFLEGNFTAYSPPSGGGGTNPGFIIGGL